MYTLPSWEDLEKTGVNINILDIKSSILPAFITVINDT